MHLHFQQKLISVSHIIYKLERRFSMPSNEYKAILELLDSMPDTSGMTFEERRADFEQQVSLLSFAENVSCEPVSVGDIPAEWIVPEGATGQDALLYLHGGGYCIGSIITHRSMVSHIAAAAKTRALLIDYRLAPENPFPAAVEDSTAAYEWLLARGIPAGNIIIAGDSAGGGLTVATLMSLKDKEIKLPAAAVLISPWTDLAITGDTIISKADIDPMVTKEGLTEMAEAYLGDADSRTPLASPLYGDLDGLPPMLIHVGAAEILLDDAARMADRATKAGVEVNFNEAEDMCHVWHFFSSMLPEAMAAIEEVAKFMRKYLKK
jgi:acetyl esterase/lipase